MSMFFSTTAKVLDISMSIFYYLFIIYMPKSEARKTLINSIKGKKDFGRRGSTHL